MCYIRELFWTERILAFLFSSWHRQYHHSRQITTLCIKFVTVLLTRGTSLHWRVHLIFLGFREVRLKLLQSSALIKQALVIQLGKKSSLIHPVRWFSSVFLNEKHNVSRGSIVVNWFFWLSMLWFTPQLYVEVNPRTIFLYVDISLWWKDSLINLQINAVRVYILFCVCTSQFVLRDRVSRNVVKG
jgi:hypothetical protein